MEINVSRTNDSFTRYLVKCNVHTSLERSEGPGRGVKGTRTHPSPSQGKKPGAAALNVPNTQLARAQYL